MPMSARGELPWGFRRESAEVEAVGDAAGDDGVGLQGIQIAGPFGYLGGQVALDGHRDGIAGVGDVSAFGLRLVVAGPAAQVHLHAGRTDEGDADFEGERPVALAGNHVAQAGGDGKGWLGGVEPQGSRAVDRNCTGGRVGVGRVIGGAVQGEAGSGGYVGGGGELVAVVEQDSGAEAEGKFKREEIYRDTGRVQAQLGGGVDSIGGEVVGIVEEVAAAAQGQMISDIGRGL